MAFDKKVYAKAYYLRHREELVAASREWREKNPDKLAKQHLSWRLAHPEEVKAEQRRYREKHREAHRQWDLNPINRAKATERQRERRRANPVKHREEIHARRASIAGNVGSYSVAEWNELVERYDHRCLRCGKQEPEIKLTVDHVIPIILGGSNYVDNLQPLCTRCNCSKNSKHIDYRMAVAA